jgi:thymidylate synthase (FAD)
LKVIKPYYEILTPIDGIQILKAIEIAGRTCYKSEDKITDDSAPKFVEMLIKRGHEAMIELGGSITIKYVCDRGVSHELVRHRIASFAQESTRYCNYSNDKFGNEITVIKPCFLKDYCEEECHENSCGNCKIDKNELHKFPIWKSAMEYAESSYFDLLKSGASPQEARSILPNSLKTEICITMNMRELRHFFKLRTAKVAHPQMLELTRPLLKELQSKIPVLFDDITWDEPTA